MIMSGKVTLPAGPSGAGKSTVLKLLMGYIQPDSGKMYLGGRLYGELSRDDLRAFMAYVL